MAVVDRVRELVAPVVADVGAELYDVEFNGGILRILVDADGGIDIDAIKTISKSSGECSTRPIRSRPLHPRGLLAGLERLARTRLHYERAVGETVKIKTFADVDGNRLLRHPCGRHGSRIHAGDRRRQRLCLRRRGEGPHRVRMGRRPKPGQGDKRPSIPESQREAH